MQDHGYTFNDAHIAMMLSSCGSVEEKEDFFKSLDEHFKQDLLNPTSAALSSDRKELCSYLRRINATLGVNLYNAIFAFDQGDYAHVVEQLGPIRYELCKIGGSNAQRDVFHQMLTQAALRSPLQSDNKFGLALVNERLAMRPCSQLTRRLAERFASVSHHLE